MKRHERTRGQIVGSPGVDEVDETDVSDDEVDDVDDVDASGDDIEVGVSDDGSDGIDDDVDDDVDDDDDDDDDVDDIDTSKSNAKRITPSVEQAFDSVLVESDGEYEMFFKC